MSGTLTIRKIDDGIKHALKLQAHLHNRSMEEEARYIIAAALTKAHPESFGDRLAAIGRRHGVTDRDIQQVESVRDSRPATPMDLA